ncbi:hypothetical protein CARUB_v10021831mg [Capsella rubella]|uniref:S-protein homolog n=1 Tax=Capsella rubella TaxID=81985 RepID=R0ICD8_9BRAS|nr:hypothetical protein CARUB_v10021831mg [Capsella rubella]
MKNSSKLLVVLSIIFCYVINPCHGFNNPFAKTVVTITNKIPSGRLEISCRSKDDDLGKHVLRTGEKIQWTFRPSWFRTTLFTCRIFWNGQVRRFDAYNADRDQDQCNGCSWTIMPNRFCLSGTFDGNFYFNKCYRWK